MMHGFTAMFRKELTQMLRDRGTLFFALVIPVFELILFGVIDMNARNIPTVRSLPNLKLTRRRCDGPMSAPACGSPSGRRTA